MPKFISTNNPISMPSVNQQTPTIPASTTFQIRDILSTFLTQCNMTYPHDVALDESFRDACYADAIRRGFDLKLMKRPLDVGIAIADTSYRHLENYSTRVFIAVWTGIVVYIDDYYEDCADGLTEFFDRFLRQEPQRYPVFDHVVAMFHEVPLHWGTITSNMITTAELDFITASIMDKDFQSIAVDDAMAPQYSQFRRRMSGISRAYSIFGFPSELDLATWIQVLPDLISYLDHANDLLSFYKEELDGETINFVSMSASSKGISKIEELKSITEETIRCYKRGVRLLEPFPEAQRAFRSSCMGYIGFHALSPRYKLSQLGL